jgi:hypothetical protein
MSARIPFDDHKLEMEEIEGFLPTTQITSNKVDARPLGSRWSCAFLTIGIFLGILFMSDTEYLKFSENDHGSNLVHIQEKPDDESNSAPSAIPTSQISLPVTPSPSIHGTIIQSVISDTPQPTEPVSDKPTDTITEMPTDAVTEVMTSPPTDAVTEVMTSPPTEMVTEVMTFQPTDLVNDSVAEIETLLPTVVATEITSQPSNIVNITDTAQPTDVVVPLETSQPTSTYIAKGIEGAIPKEDINDPTIDFSAAHYPKPSYVVTPDPPLTLERAEALAQEWGKWEFVDQKADQRPKEDYCSQFPQRDIPRDSFPSEAWQIDREYLEGYLDQGIKLVNRAMEAILAEYGHGPKDDAGKSLEDREKDMFHWMIYTPGDAPSTKYLIQEAGWTTEKSFQGLVRRLLHTIMTRDVFTVVLGGHSGAGTCEFLLLY